VFCFQGPHLLEYDTMLVGMLVIWNVSNHLPIYMAYPRKFESS